MKSKIFALAVVLTLNGCGAWERNSKPVPAFNGKSVKNSKSAVLSTRGLNGNLIGQVSEVDGIKMSCLAYGCPSFVRISEGTHTFTIKAFLLNGINYYRSGQIDLVVKDMKARHIYEVTIKDHGETFGASYNDLGENPVYGITLGLKGINQKFIPIRFED
ncbi:hypothetical protein [Xanthomonas arboricola]|uniref:hypothetical protein n=1 Tax=Xanthomonas arboricola TaxID=56448 RepID=UPI00128FE9A9|nr:hypothetical protein [Xanthomonas arboricola]